MDRIMRDLRLAFRSLRRRPGFNAVILLTLALGIGVNVSVFQIVYGLVLQPLPFVETGNERDGLLVALGMRHATMSVEAFDFSPPDVEDFSEQCRVCQSVAVHDRQTVVLAAGLQTGETSLEDGARRMNAEAVSPELFEMLNVPAFRGRVLLPGEDVPGGPRVAVLSHRLWRQLGEAEDLIGRDLLIDGHATEVVGIMPEGFHFPERTDLWLPLERRSGDPRSQRWMDNVIARLEPGTSLQAAQAEAEAISKHLATAHPDSNQGWSFTVMPYRERLVEASERQILALLLGAVLFVLLIACVNVTNLLLAQESDRRRSSAIRMALGSDRWLLIRQRMTENMVRAFGGATLGILLSAWALDYLKGADPRGWPAWLSFEIGGETLIFTVGLTLLSTLIFGLFPSLRAANPSLDGTFGFGTFGVGQRGTADAKPQRVQHGLVIAQIALALPLLVGASLMVRSVTSLLHVDAGFETANLLTLRAQLTGERTESPEERREFLTSLLERLESVPGVEAAAATSAMPLMDDGTAIRLSYPGQVLRAGEGRVVSYILQTPGLFDLLDVPLISGRQFTPAEMADPDSRVVIINDELAAEVWGRRDPTGDRIQLGYDDDAPWLTVIGVVPKIYYEEPGEETDQSRLQVHLPYAHNPWRRMGILVRTAGDPAALATTVQRELSRFDPAIAVDSLYALETVRRQALWAERLIVELFGSFAFLALALSALGIYGVMAYAVAQRRREIGVRMALGANLRDVRSLFLVRGLLMIAPGIALGALGAVASGRFLGHALYGVEAGDPMAFGAALFFLLAAAAIGIVLPARRATQVEPAVALQQD